MPDVTDLQNHSLKAILQELRDRESSAMDSTADIALNDDFQDFDSDLLIEVARDRQGAIYGSDDRHDIFNLDQVIFDSIELERVLNDADCVAGIFEATDIEDNGNGTSTLHTTDLASSIHNVIKLCNDEAFMDQPTGASCSGFLVAPDIIATAGHCISNNNLNDVLFVFGFRMVTTSDAQLIISNDDIYRGIDIIGQESDDTGPDWALVRLDRAVTNHSIAAIRRNGQIADDAAVHIIGHPAGLPLKFAGGALVNDNSSDSFFVANLDAFGGNSGSPVFNSDVTNGSGDTHLVEGILVRGEPDFVLGTTCIVSLVCPNNPNDPEGCRGEDCTRTTEFSQFVP